MLNKRFDREQIPSEDIDDDADIQMQPTAQGFIN